MPSRPKEFRGKLTPEEAAAGMNLAAKNARRLASDAQLLLDAERVPTAAAVAALAIEEAGKLPIIRGILVARSDEEVKEEWRRYRDHRSKNGAWITPDLVADGARTLAALASTVDRDGEHTIILNSLKQLGFYSDCCGNGANWSDPSTVIDRKLAELLVDRANILVPKKDVTVRELELWQQHLGSVWNTEEMPNALLRWATAMHTEGLSETTPAEYEAFVFGRERGQKWPERREH